MDNSAGWSLPCC